MRLALSPNIDGKIEPEEWDPFTTIDGVDTYFQWQPEMLHFAAAHVPVGSDLIISIDGHGDGWLVGRDNLEVRIHWDNNTPQVTERVLDNTPVSGPMWVDAPNFKASTIIAGSSDDKGRTVELSIEDPNTHMFPEKASSTVGIRFDIQPESTPPADPLFPRVMVPARVTLQRGEDLPQGLTWKPEVPARTIVPGEGGRIRLDFTGSDELGLKRVDMRTEGLAQNDTFSSGVPFPTFDKKGWAHVDYDTKVAPDASLGYRVMRANVVDASGKTAVLETSYEIAPLVSFGFRDKLVTGSSDPKIAKFSCELRSNTGRRVQGMFRVDVPEGWKVKTGNNTQFVIYEGRSSYKVQFSVLIPGGFKGTAPIKLIADFAGQHSEDTEYIVVQ